MEIVYLLLLFLGPGLAIDIYKRRFMVINTTKTKGTIYEQLFEDVAHSTIITTITIGVVAFIHFLVGSKFPPDIGTFIAELSEFKQLVAYIIVCVIVTILWYKVYENFFYPKFLEKHEQNVQEKRGLIYTNNLGLSVWQSIFFTKEENNTRKIVSIFKDGNYITSGEITNWNMGFDEKRELRIFNSHIIEAVLKADKEKEIPEKLLYNVEKEYYDVENGTLIRFYDPRKIDEHWDEL